MAVVAASAAIAAQFVLSIFHTIHQILEGKTFEKKVLDEKARCPSLRAGHQRARANLISSSWAEPVGTWLGWFGQGSARQGLGEIGRAVIIET